LDRVLWHDSIKHIKIFMSTEKPVFSTDIPVAFIKVLNYRKQESYEYSLGYNYEIIKDSVFIYQKNQDRQYYLEGWYFKDEYGDFVDSLNTKLIYENGLLYRKENNNYQSVVQKNFYINSKIEKALKSSKIEMGNLYKYDNDKIIKVANSWEEIKSVKSGIYYIPLGSSIECVFTFNHLSNIYGS